ncbi:hypothetical protein [Kribbella kalugense]|uniref:Uncharacterized protein n=1 Tax=Kribbella kalugense TaxID=2512221 RepID=A0A4R7ZNN5_9ACTN|nr:hypothetical protein [Kribbella kalugense]TDW18946.1 hypothetical protein EV650_5549 [Kribbella kalugense]
MEPILISIAAAIAAKGAGSVYDLVKRRFGRDPEAMKELEAAETAPADPAAVEALAARLDLVRSADPSFAAELNRVWDEVPKDQRVVNQISGPVSGKVVQAGEVTGNINF